MDYKVFYEVEQKRADKAEDALAAALARAEAAETTPRGIHEVFEYLVTQTNL